MPPRELRWVGKSILDGIWRLVRAELAGVAAPELVTAKTAVELSDGVYVVRFDGEIMDQGTFEVSGPNESPTLLLRGSAGPNAGRIIPCIYQLAGNRLRICYGLGGVAPTEFTTALGDDRYLAVYRRQEEETITTKLS